MYRPLDSHQRGRLLQRSADRDLERWAKAGDAEEARAFELEAIGMSPASARVHREERHERTWDFIESMDEAHHKEDA